jgi:hypothetical protein
MNPLRLAATLAALCGALGAATPAAAGARLADPAAFPFRTLPADGSLELTLDASSPTFEFQSGPSAFGAFRLPDSGGPFRVEVRSFLSGPADPRRARVFYPVVAVLTDDFLVSRATDPELLRFDLPELELTSAPAYRVTLGLDPGHTRERYLVVYTPAGLDRRAPRPAPATPEAAAEAARTAFLGAAPYGRLRITVHPDEAAAAPPAAPH